LYHSVVSTRGRIKYMVKKKRAKRDTYLYSLKDGNRIVYIGQSQNPPEREQEHRSSEKKFTKMDVRPIPMSEKTALKREEEWIESYKSSHDGKPPKYNKD